MSIFSVKITFTEEVLGTASSNKDIHREYIADKAPDALSREEEVEAIGVDGVMEKSMTIFPKEDGMPFFFNYQWKGYFKDACAMLARCPGTITYRGTNGTVATIEDAADNKSKKAELKAFKKIIDGCIFVEPRKIFIDLNGPMGLCQRPLRGNTAQGERIALATSETVPAGSSCILEVNCLNDAYDKYVREWFEYGKHRGTGQWRNSGKGTFTFEYLDDNDSKARKKKK